LAGPAGYPAQGSELAGFVQGLTRDHGAGLTDPGRVVGCATGLFSIAAGVIHVSAAADHQNLPVMMIGFISVAILQVALGGLLIWRRPHKLLLIAALGLMLGSVGMWLISRTSGLPFLPGGHMEPIGFKDSVTVLFELATVPGLLLLMSPDLGGVRLPSARLGTQGLAFLAAFIFTLFVPALMLDGGAHHAAGQAGHPHADGGHGEGQTLKAGAGHHGAGKDSAHGHAGGSKAGHGKGGHDDGGHHKGSGGGNAELAQADTEAPGGGHAHGGSGDSHDTGSGGSGSGGSMPGGHEHGGGEHKSLSKDKGAERGGSGHEHAGGGHDDKGTAKSRGKGPDHNAQLHVIPLDNSTCGATVSPQGTG